MSSDVVWAFACGVAGAMLWDFRRDPDKVRGAMPILGALAVGAVVAAALSFPSGRTSLFDLAMLFGGVILVCVAAVVFVRRRAVQ